MDAHEILKQILESNPELARAISEATGRNAGGQQLSGILADAGIDAATADELLAEYQRKSGAAIGAQELDEEALDQVAGGGTGNSCSVTDDCDEHFMDACASDYYHPNWNCSTNFSCTYTYECDETFYQDH